MTTKNKQLSRKTNEINSEENKLAYKKQSALVKKLVRKKDGPSIKKNYTWKVGKIQEKFSTSTTNC